MALGLTAYEQWTPTMRSPRQESVREMALNVYVFLIPASIGINFRLYATLFASDVLLLAPLPFLLLSRDRPAFSPWVRALLWAGGAWAISQMVTDLVVGTSFSGAWRGAIEVLFFSGNLAACYIILIGSPRRLVIFGVGLVFGLASLNVLDPSPIFERDRWKFGWGVPATFGVVMVSTARIGIARAVLLASIAVANLFLGYRAQAGELIVTLGYVLWGPLAGTIGFGRRSAVLTVLIVAASGWAVLQIYGWAASEGLLGDDAAQIYTQQSSGSLGILIGGRLEVHAAVLAIRDSPIIGHGSGANDPSSYYNLAMLDFARDHGYDLTLSSFELGLYDGKIPSHSHLPQAWIEAGLAGGVFWMIVIGVTGTALVRFAPLRHPIAPLVAFAGIVLLWDIMFQPFGSYRRVMDAYLIVVMISALHIARDAAGSETAEADAYPGEDQR